ncbi:MAG: flavodoxin family protein [Hyphomicrobiales bacterium]|nr:flavodoxin family protein [Hyphomicrobiales bacterium]
MPLNPMQEQLCADNPFDFSGLKAVFINCTLKPSPEVSNTDALMEVSREIMRKNGIDVTSIRAVDHDIAYGVYPDMQEHGYKADAWPELWPTILAADILVIGSPIWLGQYSAACKLIIERLYAMSGQLNDNGQWIFYGKAGGCVVTGNEDGVKHCAMEILYSLQHLGYVVPPQADTGWIGAIGPGPSYLDEGSGGPQSDFTQRNTTFMTWNLMHMARLLRDAGGFPAHGNQRAQWDAGCRFDHPNPDYR